MDLKSLLGDKRRKEELFISKGLCESSFFLLQLVDMLLTLHQDNRNEEEVLFLFSNLISSVLNCLISTWQSNNKKH